jgi:hypothetical protein
MEINHIRWNTEHELDDLMVACQGPEVNLFALWLDRNGWKIVRQEEAKGRCLSRPNLNS